MKIINHLADQLFAHQKKLEILALFLLFLAVSFRFTNSKTSWIWNNHSFIALIIIVSIVLIALIWIKIEKTKTNNLISSIKQDISVNESQKQYPSDELSARQKEVFDLIIAGKSNKEIMSELSIEQSTLKTHINKIYKTLGIDSRKQVKKLISRAD